MDLSTFATMLLDDACPNFNDDGSMLFYIESHCVGYWITATPRADDMQTGWVIHNIDTIPA